VRDLTQLVPGWDELLEEQPAESASREITINWVEQFLPTIEAEIASLEESIKQLEQHQTDLKERYAAQFDLSLGLSPNLEFEKIEVIPAERVQPAGLMTLVGGVCGLLLWIFKELVRITNQIKRDEQAKANLVSE
jgi:predicted nuclease with TOPRIM domain